MAKDKIIIAEHFYSIQGEGPTMGRPSVFVRLGGCNLFCNGSWRCDTIEVWQNGKARNIKEFARELEQLYPVHNSHLIITGGEPLLQQEAIVELLDSLTRRPLLIEIETNGTILPTFEIEREVNQWNVSIKLSSSGEPREKRIIDNSIRQFVDLNPLSVFKFVCDSNIDIEEIKDLKTEYCIDENEIWLMPACDSRQTLIEKSAWLADVCLKNGYNFSPRLQLLIWDKTVGV